MVNTETFFKKLTSKTNSRLSDAGPEKDWKIIFMSAIFLTLLSIVVNLLIFIKVDKGEIFVVEAPGQSGERTLNPETLRETVRYYQAKAEEFQTLQSAPATGLVDPSI
ncbi:MAG: hypothetical protein Q7R67_01590 [bacterium]|nr:hypothetical protein [bacterium]